MKSAGGPVRKKVRVANLRTPGTTRGHTLFNVGDMLRYLDEVAGEQAEDLKAGCVPWWSGYHRPQ